MLSLRRDSGQPGPISYLTARSPQLVASVQALLPDIFIFPCSRARATAFGALFIPLIIISFIFLRHRQGLTGHTSEFSSADLWLVLLLIVMREENGAELFPAGVDEEHLKDRTPGAPALACIDSLRSSLLHQQAKRLQSPVIRLLLHIALNARLYGIKRVRERSTNGPSYHRARDGCGVIVEPVLQSITLDDWSQAK